MALGKYTIIRISRIGDKTTYIQDFYVVYFWRVESTKTVSVSGVWTLYCNALIEPHKNHSNDRLP